MEKVQKELDIFFKARNDTVKMLEAGCGSISKFNFSNNVHITGIDISQKQLDRNKYISTKILGDLEKYHFDEGTFDIIISWHVLEHLKHPQKAMKNLIWSLNKGGLLIVGCPNPLSLKGLVTKFTPHVFHTFFYRNIYGRKEAGIDDVGPFKTYMKFFISPRYLSSFAKQNGLQVKLLQTDDALNYWAGDLIKKKSKLLFFLITGFDRLLRKLSFNYLGDSEFYMVFIKSTNTVIK